MRIELPDAVKQIIAKLIEQKIVILAIASIGLIVFTAFSTYTLLFPERDEAEAKRLQDETVFTEFDDEGIQAIENLIKVGEGIESEFDPDRSNPFE